MTKPHEEKWFADDDGSVYVGEGRERMTFLEPSPGPPADMPARGRLAAGAPAMARLLIEWDTEGSLDTAAVQRVLRAAGVLP